MPKDEMDRAIAALEAYGYVLVGERYVRPGKQTQQWMPQGDHFLRFDDPSAVPMAHHVREDAVRKDGLVHTDPAHAENFDWEWPAEEVARIYEGAVK
jgi:hypothetical protein